MASKRFSLEAVFKAVDKMTAPVNKIDTRMKKFTRSMNRGLAKTNKGLNAVTRTMKTGLTAGVVALTGAVTGLFTATAALTSIDVRAQRLAESVSMNVTEVEALSNAVAGAGFDFDHVIDLVKEMNNKLGESAGLEQIMPVKEALYILGLEYDKIRKLAPEEQFKNITDAALQMADAQQAASALDILMGGEANKILGVLRQQGRSVDEITAKYKLLNLRTDESRKGSILFAKQMSFVKTAVSSLSLEFGGLMGQALTPMIEKLTTWLTINRELVQEKISKTVNKITGSVQHLIDNFDKIVSTAKKIGKALAIFVIFISVLKTLVAVLTIVNLLMAANPVVLAIMGIVAALAALALLMMKHWEPIKEFFSKLWGGVVAIFEAGVNKIKAIFESVLAFFQRVEQIGDEKIRAVADKLGINIDAEAGKQNLAETGSAMFQSSYQQLQVGKGEITIRDETGKAEVSKAPAANSYLQLQQSGAF